MIFVCWYVFDITKNLKDKNKELNRKSKKYIEGDKEEKRKKKKWKERLMK